MSAFRIGELDAVLIHIPKTGGTSLRKGTFSDIEGPYYGELPPHFAPYFKFAFVREPINRFLSCVSMFKFGTIDEDGTSRRSGTQDFTIEKAIEILGSPGLRYDENRKTYEEKFLHHALPMAHPFNQISEANFVGRFEQFTNDFNQVCKLCGLTPIPALPVLHSSKQVIDASSLTKRQIKILQEYYEQDYRMFNY